MKRPLIHFRPWAVMSIEPDRVVTLSRHLTQKRAVRGAFRHMINLVDRGESTETLHLQVSPIAPPFEWAFPAVPIVTLAFIILALTTATSSWILIPPYWAIVVVLALLMRQSTIRKRHLAERRARDIDDTFRDLQAAWEMEDDE